MSRDVNVLALVKGDEKFVFMFDEDSRAETLRTLGKYASNPELNFTWYDAAVMSQKIRRISCEAVEVDMSDSTQRLQRPLAGGPMTGDDPLF